VKLLFHFTYHRPRQSDKHYEDRRKTGGRHLVWASAIKSVAEIISIRYVRSGNISIHKVIEAIGEEWTSDALEYSGGRL